MGLGESTPGGDWFDNIYIPAYNEYKLAFNSWENEATRTKSISTTFYDAEKEFKPFYRELYIGFLKGNPLVTDTDLVVMELPQRREKTSMKSPVAKDFPFLKVITNTIRYIIIEFSGSEIARAKPEGQSSMEFVYIVAKEQPTEITHLTNTCFCTHTPLNIEFLESDRGKIIYFSARWVNTRGEKGPWSPIYSPIIP
ncbi:MAG: hypothetical protein LBS54_09565 [Dysgonamonadaceae bacterium]|jgi:hypothetical protein|nr:hypothetical protein [Dysgonamonadaceae bacterium]